MRERAERIDRLIEDLFQYSQAGRALAPPETVELRAIVDDVVTFLGPKRHSVVVDHAVETVTASPVGFALVLR